MQLKPVHNSSVMRSAVPVVGGLVILFLLFRFFRPWLVPGLLLLALFTIGYFLYRKVTRQRGAQDIERRNDELRSEARKRSLVADLRRFSYSDARPELVQRARKTIKVTEAVLNIWDQFETSLNEKLNPGELTYSRYHTAARRLYNETLHQVKNVHPKLELLASQPADNPEAQKFLEGQLVTLDSLIGQFESAQTALTQLTVALGELNTDPSRASGEELDRTIAELNRLAERTKDYSV